MAGPQQAVRFKVPGAPKGKGRPRFGRVAGQVRTFTPAETRSEEGAVKWFAMRAMAGAPPMQGALAVELRAYLPIPASWSKRKQAAASAGKLLPTSKPDLDNVGKLVLDAIQKVVFSDDSQIAAISMFKSYSVSPRIEVVVRALAPEPEGAST